jgi:hypothetical protein
MTQREQVTPEHGRPRLLGPPQTERPASSAPGSPGESLWENWYRHAPSPQRQALLQLARTRGFVSAGELETSRLDQPHHAGQTSGDLVARLLRGQTDGLAPLEGGTDAGALSFFDADLDDEQRLAVTRSLHTPDVCLIQGLPGTGKSRVATEILRQAAAGERVLLVAPGTAALDRILERLTCEESVCPLRCLAPNEAPDQLAPCIRKFTFDERVRFFHETSLPAAREEAERVGRTLEARRKDGEVWERLAELAGRHAEVGRHIEALYQRQARVEAEVEGRFPLADADGADCLPFYRDVLSERTDTRARAEARGEEIHKEQEAIRYRVAETEAERARLRPLLESGWRFWTAAFWKGWFRKGARETIEHLRREAEECARRSEALARETEELEEELARSEDRFTRQRQKLLESEVASALALLKEEEEALLDEQKQLGDKWQVACRELTPGTRPPDSPTPEAVARARQAWAEQIAREEAEEVRSREWVAALEEAAPHFPARLVDCANVVAATPAGLSQDPHFGDGQAVAFDLLVLEEAHRVSEETFRDLARRARRWVLIGESDPFSEDEGPSGQEAASPKRNPRTGRGRSRDRGRRPDPGPPPVRRVGVLQQLWEHLHLSPRHLPYRWVLSGGRLRCQLYEVSPDEERWVEAERVADRPEIELIILDPPPLDPAHSEPPHLPRGPKLVEINFPPTMPLPDAKQYVYSELEELAVESHGREVWWQETDREVVLHFADPEPDPSAQNAFPLGAGVQEVLAPYHPRGEEARAGALRWHTTSLRFEVAQGWTPARARAWVEEKLALRDLGRATHLHVAHRGPALLTRFLSDLLFRGTYRDREARQANGERSAVEFIAVPPLSEAWTEKRPRNAPRPPRGGAGFECDLGDPKGREKLPADVRQVLPRRGLINYPEAQAVVDTARSLLANPAFRRDAATWQGECPAHGETCRCDGTDPARGPHRVAVGIMALYPAQAELIRLLLRRAGLEPGALRIQVGLPEDFQQRDALVALVSLTRSHARRAVPFGDGPEALAQALTRCAARLILFGDPGTLARRSQWQGALDHLAAPSAERERALADQLVQYLQGRGPHPRAFQVLTPTHQPV